MRVLVINVNRSGSTNLSKGISNYFNIPYFPTPFRNEILHRPKDLEWYSNNNNLLHQRIVEVDYSFLRKLCSMYSNIILTSRLNLKEAAESYSYMLHRFNDRKDKFGSHTTRYKYEDKGNFNEVYKKVLDTHIIAEKLSEEFRVPITYYEDLYYNEPKLTLENLNLGIDYETFKENLDTSKRLRVVTVPTVI